MAVANDAVELGNATLNTTYDMLWEGETQITTEGWETEYRIPISNLRIEKKAGTV